MWRLSDFMFIGFNCVKKQKWEQEGEEEYWDEQLSKYWNGQLSEQCKEREKEKLKS